MTNDEMMSLKVGDLVLFNGNHRLTLNKNVPKYGFVTSINKGDPFVVLVEYFDIPISYGQPSISRNNCEFWSIAK